MVIVIGRRMRGLCMRDSVNVVDKQEKRQEKSRGEQYSDGAINRQAVSLLLHNRNNTKGDKQWAECGL